jgi:hypothetical protein
MLPFLSRPAVTTVLTLTFVAVLAGPSPSSSPSVRQPLHLHASETSNLSPVARAQIGLLPDVHGVSLDLLLIGLVGAGYGMARLHRLHASSPPPGRDGAPDPTTTQQTDSPSAVVFQ